MRLSVLEKKYQWLALYELGARLADNYAFIGQNRHNTKTDTKHYKGENFGYLRNIDPSLLIRQTHDGGWERFTEPTWWSPIIPQLGRSTPSHRLHWLYSNEDMIDDSRCIDVTDRLGNRWLVLQNFLTKNESQGEFGGFERNTWSRITCLVVRKKSLNLLLTKLKTKDLGNSHSLPALEFSGTESYIGEYPWHPSFLNFDSWIKSKDCYPELPVAVRPTVTEYSCERSGYDYSAYKNIQVNIPAPWLINALDLHLSDGIRPCFYNAIGKRIFFDPALAEVGPHAAVIDRNAFLDLLERENLAALWVIAGEKGVYGGRSDGFGGILNFTTLYWLRDQSWMSHKHQEFEAPTKGQIEKMLGKPVPPWVRTR